MPTYTFSVSSTYDEKEDNKFEVHPDINYSFDINFSDFDVDEVVYHFNQFLAAQDLAVDVTEDQDD